MTLISEVVVKFFIIFWVCLIGFWLVSRFIAFPLFARYDAKKHNGERWFNSWHRFYSNFETFFTVALATTIVAGGLMFIISLIGVVGIYENHICEPIVYEQYKVEYATITNILDKSEDVVNSDVYLRANDYNKEITKLKEASINPNYKFNFTGDYDWSALPTVEIKEKS